MDKMDPITVIFVLSNDLEDERGANEIMLKAFEACKHNKFNSIWVKERDIYKKELKKIDFIVFETFEGKDFENIKEKKSASIVGPWCVLICLMEGKNIPNLSGPTYNVAMYDCIVTSSDLFKHVELEISEKVRMMGGYYCDGISDNTTHLITDSVKSAKYMKAMEMNIKVLTPSWIDSVWEASQEANIHCNDSQFDKFKCQPLHNLNICTTGFSSLEEREAVRKMVTENGAKFQEELNLQTTDFLICRGSAGKMSKKYIEARKTVNISCVTSQWPSSSSTNGAKGKVFTECDNLIEQIDIEKAKKSGQFLDGCSGLSLLISRSIITEKDLTLSQKEKETLEDENEGRESQCPQIFRGFTFFVTSSDDELELAHMQEQIEGGRGSITTNINEANFVVLPYFIIEDIDYDEAITINELWIDDCITKEEVLPVEYYHCPLFIRNRSVLDHCVVTISGYSENERKYLTSLILMLGGTSQEEFCRITSVERNVLGSTHLVTAKASGKKYEGALKWRLPAVDKDWLIACARSGTKLPEQEYSVSKNSHLLTM